MATKIPTVVLWAMTQCLVYTTMSKLQDNV